MTFLNEVLGRLLNIKQKQDEILTPFDSFIPAPAPTPEEKSQHTAYAENQTVHISKIAAWAKAIEHQEGGTPTDRNIKNNNPGNLKFTPLTQSLGAQKADKDNFCIFPTYLQGLNALQTFLGMACRDQLIPYQSTMTIKEFTKVYALPPNDNYALGVAKACGVDVNTQIKFLL